MGDSQDVADNVAGTVIEWLKGKFLLKFRHLDEEDQEEIKEALAKVIHDEIKDFI